MIALTRARRRRTIARIRGQRKCTEPVVSSSDLPTDHRRSDNHSESHQPQTLRSRCIGDSMGRMATGQAPLGRNSVQIADKVSGTRPGRCVARRDSTRQARSRGRVRPFEGDAAGRRIAATKNAPSRWRLRPTFRLTAAEATAYRRAINLWRSVLGASRTLGSSAGARQGGRPTTCRKLRSFLFAQGQNCASQRVL